MTRIRGLRKLNKAVTIQLKPFGIDKAECSTEYAYYRNSERISFKLTEDTLEDRWFMEFVKERFGYNVKYPFIFSLLHEVGHHMTDDDLDDMTYDFCEGEKAYIDSEMQTATDIKTCKALEWKYFGLPDEILATTWAVDYMKSHPVKIERMWNEILVALEKFYRKNGVM